MGDFSIFAVRIKELRLSLNMTQRDFAGFVGCTAATLSAYENGVKSPSLEIVKTIAEKCHVSIDWLCGLSQKKRLTDEIETYSDLFKLLLEIGKSTKINFKTIDLYDMGYDGPVKYYTLAIYFENTLIDGFIEEWEKIKSLHDTGTIDDDIYDLWVEKTLNKEINSQTKLDGGVIMPVFDPEEELPFN